MKLMCFLVLCSVLISSQAAVLKNGVEIPQYAKVCHRLQNDFNQCLKGSIQTLIKKISKDGISQIGFPPLDPWKVDEFHIKNSGSPIKVGLNLTDINVHRFSKLQILGVRSNFKDPKAISLDVDFLNKKVLGDGKYLAEGHLSEVPVSIRGKFSVVLTNVTGTLKIKGHTIKKNGEEFFRIDRSIFKPTIGDMKIQMANENNKYPEMNNLLVGLLNQFWRPIYEETLPYFQKVSDQVFTTRFNEATLKIPYDQLIPL